MSQRERNTPRPLVEAAGGYSVPRARTPVDLHLDANEGVAAPPEVLDARPAADEVRRYPKKDQLEARLADYLGTDASQVLVTAGGDDAIDRVCRAFLGPDRNLVVPTPSFVMIGNSAKLAGAEVREVEWETPKFPLEAFLESIDADTGVAAVVSPNNPNGFVATAEDVRALAKAAPHVLILLDLAYVEFAEDDLSNLAFELPNVVAVRTFSKARGLAGLRVGYAFGDRRWIQVLRASGGPYPVSVASLAVAKRSLEVGEPHVIEFVDSVRANRGKLAARLESVGAPASPSHGNFLLADVRDGARFRDAMAGMGIAVRAWPGHERLGARSRITVPASADELERVGHAIEVCQKPQAIVFDVDGVLVDVRGSYRASIIGTCEHFGVEVGHEDIVEMKARGDANNDWVVSRRLLAQAGVEVELEEVTKVFESLYQGTDDTPGLWREERTLVDRQWFERLVERGYHIALVTGRPRRDAHRFVESSGFENLFGAVVCMEDADRKPSPEPLNLALEQLGVSSAWFLGDTVDDIACARAARALPLGVVAPGEDRARAEDTLVGAGAAVVWDSVKQIEEWLP